MNQKAHVSGSNNNVYFKNPSQEFVYVRTYARWLDDKKRRETWPETVKRYVDFLKSNLGDKVPAKVYRKIEEKILAFEVMPSMRALWSAGEVAADSSVTMYNCSFVAIDCVDAYAEMLYNLCCGAGVGFSVEEKYISQLPSVPATILPAAAVNVVDDSKEGWADSVKLLMNSLYSGSDISFDYSAIRPAGAKLKRMGGRASGPAPLINVHNFVRDTFQNARGRKLSTLECHDLACQIAECIVSGGVRRSSLISLSDLSDVSMAEAKTGNFPTKRYMSNNSAVFDKKPTAVEFLKEWSILASSGTGERGIYNREAAQKLAPKRRDGSKIVATNPCFAKETLIVTKEGMFPVEQLVGKKVDIWNGESWQAVDNFRVTAQNEKVLKLTLHDGSSVRLTPYHTCILEDGTKVKAQDLKVGDRLMPSMIETHGTIKASGAYLKGFLVGDGTQHGGTPILWLYDTKYSCEKRLIESAREVENGAIHTNAIEDLTFIAAGDNRKKMTGLSPKKHELHAWASEYKNGLPAEVFAWDERSKCEFLAGLFDSDGTASDTKNGFMYQITSINEKLLLDTQFVLKSIGVISKVVLTKEAGVTDFNDGYGEYKTQPSYRLTISQEGSIKFASQLSFSRLTSFAEKKCIYTLKKRYNKIVEIKEDGVEEKVYCCTVNGSNSFSLGIGVHTNNCGEVQLRSAQFCNLSEVVLRADDDLDSLLEKVETATWIGVIQSSFTNFKYLRPIWKQNCDEERLLGVSITGQQDAPHLLTKDALKALKARALKVAKSASAKLGINYSVSITLTKPSGSVSQLCDSASGLHPRFDHYYIRRYRIAAVDPLFKMMQFQDVPMTPENGQSKSAWKNASAVYQSTGNLVSAKSGCSIFEPSVEWSEDKVNTWVVSFPIEAPKTSKIASEMSAFEQLEWYKHIQTNWCEHNASCTIYVKDSEWFAVGNWVYENWDIVNGLSFLPYDNSKYEQMPYESITKEQYDKLVKELKAIDYSALSVWEDDDNTTGAKSLACVGSSCELP